MTTGRTSLASTGSLPSRRVSSADITARAGATLPRLEQLDAGAGLTNSVVPPLAAPANLATSRAGVDGTLSAPPSPAVAGDGNARYAQPSPTPIKRPSTPLFELVGQQHVRSRTGGSSLPGGGGGGGGGAAAGAIPGSRHGRGRGDAENLPGLAPNPGQRKRASQPSAHDAKAAAAALSTGVDREDRAGGGVDKAGTAAARQPRASLPSGRLRTPSKEQQQQQGATAMLPAMVLLQQPMAQPTAQVDADVVMRRLLESTVDSIDVDDDSGDNAVGSAGDRNELEARTGGAFGSGSGSGSGKTVATRDGMTPRADVEVAAAATLSSTANATASHNNNPWTLLDSDSEFGSWGTSDGPRPVAAAPAPSRRPSSSGSSGGRTSRSSVSRATTSASSFGRKTSSAMALSSESPYTLGAADAEWAGGGDDGGDGVVAFGRAGSGGGWDAMGRPTPTRLAAFHAVPPLVFAGNISVEAAEALRSLKLGTVASNTLATLGRIGPPPSAGENGKPAVLGALKSGRAPMSFSHTRASL